MIGVSVAAAVSACLATARLLARRRRPLTDPAPGLDHRDPLATPAVRAARRAAAEGPDGEPAPGIDRSPSVVPVGQRGGEEVTVDCTRPLRLAGPSTTVDAAARAFLVAYLSRAQPIDGAVVVAGSELADRLLPDIAAFPGLARTGDPAEAVDRAELELLARSRVVDRDGHPDRSALLADDSGEAMPLLLLVADTAPALDPRLDAVLTLGRRVGITALLLGDAPAAVTLDDTATVTDPGDRLHLAGTAMSTLDPGEAAEMLAAVAAARAIGTDAQPLPTPGGPAPAQQDPRPGGDPADEFPPPPADGIRARPIEVTLLGSPRIDTASGEVRKGLRGKARELLAYLLLHPAGVTVEAARETLWPDGDPRRSADYWRTTLSNLQTTLRQAAALDPATRVVDRVADRLRPGPELIGCDLWRFEAALARATLTRDDSEVTAALADAVALYRGDLLDGEYYDWAEPAREDLRGRALDAAARLARHHTAAGHLDAAADALDRALTIDPYNEHLYQQLMRVHADRGQPDAITRTYRRLTTRLAELDVDPDPTTDDLRRDLLDPRPVPVGARRLQPRRSAS